MLNLIFIFIFSSIVLMILHRVAIKVHLVDKPNVRKKHKGNIPLVGGLAVFCTLLFILAISPNLLPNYEIFLFCATTLIIVGCLDDRWDLPVLPRIVIQIIVSLLMIYSGLGFENLGDLFFIGNIHLGLIFSTIFTIVAVCASINAFNMIDGIDGLLGCLSLITLCSTGIVFAIHGNVDVYYFCLYVSVALIPYILLNLGLIGQSKKVFMGDAGSTLIGFTVIWLLSIATQGDNPVISPAAFLWLIAVPVIDMIAVMFRRIYIGRSPFKPDRKHLHHIFIRAGFSSRQALLLICSMSILCAFIGIIGNFFINESVLFLAFILLLLSYIFSMKHIWRLLCLYRKFKKYKNRV